MHFINRTNTLNTIGVALTLVGVLLTICWKDFFRYLLANELVLEPTSRSFKLWKKPPVALNFDIYLYNWTNPCNMTADDFVKPIVTQIGPFRFTEITDKTKIRWHPKNFTISYRRRSAYYFNEAESGAPLDTMITTLNAVALSAANTARDWNFIRQKQVSVGLNLYSQKVYITKSARELLFDGYQDDLIDMAREMARFDPETFAIPYDRFGWFYGRNESDEIGGHFNIRTGVDDITSIGETMQWNYMDATSYYPSDCNVVRGSGGEFYPPDARKEKPIALFNGELCRPLDLYFTEEIEVDGVNAYKYSATERSVDNGTKYPESSCFSYGESVPSGVMNVSACRYGAPVFISFPHFYAADPIYLDFVEGQKPVKSDHEFYIALEPLTGIPVQVAARLQANALIRPSANIALFQEAPFMFFPLIWFEQKVKIPSQMLADVKIAVNMPTIGYVCTGIITGLGIILLTWLRLQRKPNAIDDKEKMKKGIEFQKGTVNLAEGSPLMKKQNIDLLAKLEKPFIFTQNSEKVPSSVTTTNPVKLAPLAIDECDPEFANGVEKECIMLPQ